MPVPWKTWTGLSLKSKLIWSRLTLSRVTIIYFSVAIVHCFVQIGLQANALAINASAANALFSLLYAAHDGNETEGFAVLSGDSLRICYHAPGKIDANACPVVSNLSSSSHLSSGIHVAHTSTYSGTVMPTAPSADSLADLPSPSSSSSSVPIINTHSLLPSSIVIPTLSHTTLVPSPTVTIIIVQSSDEGDGDANDSKQSEGDVQEIIESISKRDIHEVPEVGSNGSDSGILVTGIPGSDATIQLSNACVKTLLYPAQTLSNMKREDITLIGFQVWVSGLSLVALLNESIPHLFASVVTQLIVTIWTIVQIFQTEHFRTQLIRFSVDNTCSPSSLLGNYWHQRAMAEIASATLNGIVFVVNLFLHYKLMKLFGWQTFKRIGASLTINRVYKLVLIQSIAIQLALFFMVASAGLWIDQLYNGAVGRLASLDKLYKAGVCIMFILLIPWLALGWFTIRLEMRKTFLVFLVMNLIFMGLWAGIFDSTTFRWTFVLWPFFAVMVCVSGVLMLMTFLLGIICRLNFGKGLPRYLHSLGEASDEDEYPDMEKIDFPTIKYVGRTSSDSADAESTLPWITYQLTSTLGGSGKVSDGSRNSQPSLGRTPSHSSHASSTASDAEHQTDSKHKRWVIE